MKKLLLAAVAVFGMSMSSNAAVIQDFGLDPTSAGGVINHSLGTLSGAFDDQYTFQLDHVLNLTIASVTNVFAQSSDFITNFQGSVIFMGADNAIGGGDDVTVIGPVLAGACPLLPSDICQGFAGTAILGAGNYFLDISGIANGTSGYGGNLATFAVPETPLPAAVWLFGSALGGGALLLRRRKKQSVPLAA